VFWYSSRSRDSNTLGFFWAGARPSARRSLRCSLGFRCRRPRLFFWPLRYDDPALHLVASAAVRGRHARLPQWDRCRSVVTSHHALVDSHSRGWAGSNAFPNVRRISSLVFRVLRDGRRDGSWLSARWGTLSMRAPAPGQLDGSANYRQRSVNAARIPARPIGFQPS